jgi:hypothetical protein
MDVGSRLVSGGMLPGQQNDVLLAPTRLWGGLSPLSVIPLAEPVATKVRVRQSISNTEQVLL